MSLLISLHRHIGHILDLVLCKIYGHHFNHNMATLNSKSVIAAKSPNEISDVDWGHYYRILQNTKTFSPNYQTSYKLLRDDKFNVQLSRWR
jgi:hypothetical protein